MGIYLNLTRYSKSLFWVLLPWLAACSVINPRVGVPPTVNESIALAKDSLGSNRLQASPIHSSWLSSARNKNTIGRIHCQRYEQKIKKLAENQMGANPSVSERENYELRLDAAHSRARCFQAQLLSKLDDVENVEIGTRIALFSLGLGATAAGFFDASKDIVGSLGLGAGVATGLRSFHPLEGRERLYFTAMAAIECSLMTADSVSLTEHEKMTDSLFSLLSKDSKRSSDRTKILNEGETLRQMLSARMRLQNISADSIGVVSDVPDLAPNDMKVKEKRGKTLDYIGLRAGEKVAELDGEDYNLLSTILTTKAATLRESNQEVLNLIDAAYTDSFSTALSAPGDLDNAVTLISLMVNKAIVDEQPDTASLTEASRAALISFLDDVRKSTEIAKTFGQLQQSKADSVQADVSMASAAVDTKIANLTKQKGGGQRGDDADTDALNDKWNALSKEAKDWLKAYEQAVNDIKVTRNAVNSILTVMSDYARYPQACKAIINGQLGS